MHTLQEVEIDESRWPRMFAKLRRAGFNSGCGCNGCASCQAKARRFVRGLARGARYVGKYLPDRWGSRYPVYTRSMGDRRLRLIVDMAGGPAIVDLSTDGARAPSVPMVERLDWPGPQEWEGEQHLVSRIDVKLNWQRVEPGSEVPNTQEPVVYILAKQNAPGLWLIRKVGETGNLASLRSRYRMEMRGGYTLFYALLNNYPSFRGPAKNRWRLDLEKVIARTLVRRGLRLTHHADTSLIRTIAQSIRVENPLPDQLTAPAGYAGRFGVELSSGQTYEISANGTAYVGRRWAEKGPRLVDLSFGTLIDRSGLEPEITLQAVIDQMKLTTEQKTTLKTQWGSLAPYTADWQGPRDGDGFGRRPIPVSLNEKGLYIIITPNGQYLGRAKRPLKGEIGSTLSCLRKFTLDSLEGVNVYWLPMDLAHIAKAERALLGHVLKAASKATGAEGSRDTARERFRRFKFYNAKVGEL